MKRYFDLNLKWSEKTKDKIGLPRPYYDVDIDFQKREHPLSGKNNFYLHKRIPIPWQSFPIFRRPKMGVFTLILENEKMVNKNNLCGYCGVVLNDEDDSVRWTWFEKGTTNTIAKVISDWHPMHEDCMKQAIIFCPFMRKRSKEEFEYGKFFILKKNFIIFMEYLKSIGVNIDGI